MHHSFFESVTAITEVYPDGMRLTGVRLLLSAPVSACDPSCFDVEGRTIRSVSAEGAAVTLFLDPGEENARLYFPGEPWEGKGARLLPAKVRVRLTRDIKAENGTVFAAADYDGNTAVRNLLADEFVTGSFKGLAYNLFIPRDYDPGKSYPLVQFIHDAAVCGEDPHLTLAQGVGALVWMTEEAQKKHPCFVLAPQFDMPSIVDDDWNVDHRLEVEKALLDHITSLYSIDRNRLYTTGQSMGCMSSMVLNLRCPDLFAASFFVAGQWDERAFKGSGLEKKNFWFLCSEGDAKAFPGMNQILCVLEGDGAKIARQVWRADLSQEEYREKAQNLVKTGANILYTPYEITSVANGWHSHGGEHHVHTWQTAYFIEAIHDWLFSKSNA